MEKLTYVVALNTAISALSADESMTAVVEKLTALRDAQVKRNSTERKPTKVQVENERLKDVVLSVLTTDRATITDIMNRSEELTALANQKVSALVRSLVADGKVVREEDKRKAYFRLP